MKQNASSQSRHKRITFQTQLCVWNVSLHSPSFTFVFEHNGEALSANTSQFYELILPRCNSIYTIPLSQLYIYLYFLFPLLVRLHSLAMSHSWNSVTMLWALYPCVVGPCHHGMARPQVADRGTASFMEGSCE